MRWKLLIYRSYFELLKLLLVHGEGDGRRCCRGVVAIAGVVRGN